METQETVGGTNCAPFSGTGGVFKRVLMVVGMRCASNQVDSFQLVPGVVP